MTDKPRPTALERILGNEPTVFDRSPRRTDVCQCCGSTLESFTARKSPIQDPLHVIDVGMDVGTKTHQLGSLCLCWWCITGLRDHFVHPFIEEHHQPLRSKLDRVQAILNGQADAEAVDPLAQRVLDLLELLPECHCGKLALWHVVPFEGESWLGHCDDCARKEDGLACDAGSGRSLEPKDEEVPWANVLRELALMVSGKL